MNLSTKKELTSKIVSKEFFNEEVLSSKASAMADKIAIEEWGIPSLYLMERASLEVSQWIMENSEVGQRVLVACGNGNNGGDGVCIARHLYKRGYKVTLLTTGNEEGYSKDMAFQVSNARNIGLKVHTYNEKLDGEYDILVDAIFGTGLSRDVISPWKEVIWKLNCMKFQKVISVDMPSGINGDNGDIMGDYIKSDLTITFGRNKKGLKLAQEKGIIKNIKVVEIGIPDEIYKALVES